MAFFRRRPVEHPITAFWAWWDQSGAHQLAQAIATGNPGIMAQAVTERIAEIHPDLVWETGPGSSAQHRLTVSGNGVAAVRPIAERWLRAARAADETWEYRAAREGSPTALENRLDFDGRTLHLEKTRFQVDVAENERRIHVVVFHPEFAAMERDARVTVAFLLLDWVLGEDDVERRIGSITTSVTPLPEMASVDALLNAVDLMASGDDPDAWAMLEGADETGSRVVVTTRRGMRWIDVPAFDLHHVLTAPYRSRLDGLPLPEELERLRAIEDQITASLGSSAILVAHVSTGGRRTLHYYSDSEDQNITELVRETARQAGIKLTSRRDPAWSEVRPFTG